MTLMLLVLVHAPMRKEHPLEFNVISVTKKILRLLSTTSAFANLDTATLTMMGFALKYAETESSLTLSVMTETINQMMVAAPPVPKKLDFYVMKTNQIFAKAISLLHTNLLLLKKFKTKTKEK
jgi:hypothetical protein